VLPALAQHYTVVAPSLRGAEKYCDDVTGVVITGSGHWIYEEHPAESTRLLLDFLAG